MCDGCVLSRPEKQGKSSCSREGAHSGCLVRNLAKRTGMTLGLSLHGCIGQGMCIPKCTSLPHCRHIQGMRNMQHVASVQGVHNRTAVQVVYVLLPDG